MQVDELRRKQERKIGVNEPEVDQRNMRGNTEYLVRSLGYNRLGFELMLILCIALYGLLSF